MRLVPGVHRLRVCSFEEDTADARDAFHGDSERGSIWGVYGGQFALGIERDRMRFPRQGG
jgi:hypothetical protein